jgi:type VI secretion system VasD/TssJ family lipoprotein
MSFRTGRRVLVLGAVLLAASIGLGAVVACSSGPTILPVKEPDKCTLQVVGVSVIASPRINPTELGCPRPVQLRIYQLKQETRMLNASFEDIWKKDKETLADDFVNVTETTVYPDSRQEVKFERVPDALRAPPGPGKG